jgi:putative ABC transport system permease protein
VTFIAVISRLADGISVDDAVAEANTLGYRLRGIEPPSPLDTARPPRFEVVRELDAMVAAVRPALELFVAAVGTLLLIVCANVANLLLTRGAGRTREIAVRRALGATRARVVRQLVTESAVLSCAGGIAGAALALTAVQFVRAWGAIDVPDRFRGALGRLGPVVLPRLDDVSVDGSALVFAVGLSIGTGLLFGLAPAIRLSRVERGSSGGASLTVRTRTQGAATGAGQALAAVQLALATALLIGAGLLVHSFLRLSSVPLGFDPDVQVFQLVIPGEYSPARRLTVAHDVVERVRGLSGVEAAGFTSQMPLEGSLFDPDETLVPTDWDGNHEDLQREDRSDTRMVSPDYLRALGVRLLEGRWLDDRDHAGSDRALLVNRAWARRFSPDRSPIGRTVDNIEVARRSGAPRFPWQIVGVVDDVRTRLGDGPAGTGDLTVYMDLRQWLGRNAPGVVNRPGPPNMEIQMAFGFSNGLAYAVSRDGPPLTLDDLRGVVRGVDPMLAAEGLTTMGEVFAGVTGRQRFHAAVVALFGAIAALVAAIGIYGVLAYATSRRTKEFGLRLAVGGTPRAVMGLVLRQGAMVAAAGVGAGVLLGAGSTRYLSGLLFGVTPLDPVTFGAVAAGCLAVAMLASYVPARRATRVDPVVALGTE